MTVKLNKIKKSRQINIERGKKYKASTYFLKIVNES